MIRRALRGLRGRLLLAFVATSAVTLAVAAGDHAQPAAVAAARPRARPRCSAPTEDLRAGLRRPRSTTAKAAEAREKPGEDDGYDAPRRQRRDRARQRRCCDPRYDLRERTGGARVLVADRSFTDTARRGARRSSTTPTSDVAPDAARSRSAIRALRRERPRRCSSATTSCTFAMPLYDGDDVAGVVVAAAQPDRGRDARSGSSATRSSPPRRSASRWRSALGLALSSTLTRRLGRLQRSRPADHRRRARRRPRPIDRGRDEVGDLARALGPHAGGAAPPGGGAALVRLHRLARAAHAADDAPGHDGAARRGPARRRATSQDAQEQVDERARASCAGCPCWPASCSTSRAWTPPCSCARSRSSWARSRAPSPPSSRCAPASAASSSRSIPRGPCWARADPAACARVVRILIDNALRYAPRGEPIEVSARTATATRRRARRRPRARACPTRSASTSSSASTAARRRAPRAGSASGWRSGASWPSGWAARSSSTDSDGRGACFVLTLPR